LTPKRLHAGRVSVILCNTARLHFLGQTFATEVDRVESVAAQSRAAPLLAQACTELRMRYDKTKLKSQVRPIRPLTASLSHLFSSPLHTTPPRLPSPVHTTPPKLACGSTARAPPLLPLSLGLGWFMADGDSAAASGNLTKLPASGDEKGLPRRGKVSAFRSIFFGSRLGYGEDWRTLP
jgi:hypothetical protein